MKALISIMLIFMTLLIGIAGCTEQQTQEQISAVQEQISEQVSKTKDDLLTAMQAENKEIVGTVAQTNDGLIIVADSGNYLVSGQDLSPIVGKSVKVTGTVKESVDAKIIEISSFEVINE